MKPLDEFVWNEIFQFPSSGGRAESLVWRKIIPRDKGVHELGISIMSEKKAKGKNVSYLGFLTAIAQAIRAIRTSRGFFLSVNHEPSEGEWHVHVKVESPTEEPNKKDLNDIRAELERIFTPFVPNPI